MRFAVSQFDSLPKVSRARGHSCKVLRQLRNRLGVTHSAILIIASNQLIDRGPVMSLLFAESTTVVQNITQTGYGLGSMLAMVCSWQRNRSILWAILAAVLTWFYV